MIYVDSRVGSRELIPYFKPFGVDVESTVLESADFCFCGYGPDGDALVGIERKRLSDLIVSMRDRRLSGSQIPRLLDQYQFVYLLVEGMWKPNPKTGVLETWMGGKWVAYGGRSGRKPIMYGEVDNYLNSIGLRTGIMVKRAGTEAETAAQIVNLYKHFSKPWESHTAHNQVYAPVPEPKRVGWRREQWSADQELVRAIAAQIPGVDRKCDNIAKRFVTPGDLVRAKTAELAEVDGIGKVLARRIREVWL